MHDDLKSRALLLRPEQSDKPQGDDVQGNTYEFYLLLQKLKSGGISFDAFLEQALEWATRRGRNARRP